MTCNRMMGAFVLVNTGLVDGEADNDACHNRLYLYNDNRSESYVSSYIDDDVIDDMESL